MADCTVNKGLRDEQLKIGKLGKLVDLSVVKKKIDTYKSSRSARDNLSELDLCDKFLFLLFLNYAYF